MRYLISGYYGERNLGDEAILAGILQEIQRCDLDAQFAVLSFDPADTRRRHGVEALSTSLRDPAALMRAMRAADLLVSGGGSFLHEADFALHGRSFLLRDGRLRPVPYFLSVVLLAQRVGLPVMWYAQGLGPLHTSSARRMVALAGSRSLVVTWRDPDSARLAGEIGVRSPVQLVVPDPAYALESLETSAARRLLVESGLPAGVPFIAVCPRPWLGRMAYQETLIAALTAVANRENLAVVMLPFQERLDAPLCRRIAADPRLAERAWVVAGIDDPRSLAGILGQAVFSVPMRLHAGILSAAAGTPAVALDYDPKVRAFARQTRQEAYSVTIDRMERTGGVRALEDAMMATLRRAEDRRSRLARLVLPLRREAGRTARLAVQLAELGGIPVGGTREAAR
jgi:polysaccharide pyruvyl transferase CsaB